MKYSICKKSWTKINNSELVKKGLFIILADIEAIFEINEYFYGLSLGRGEILHLFVNFSISLISEKKFQSHKNSI